MTQVLAEEKENNKLPKDWELVKFENYIDLKGGSQPPKSEFKDEPEEGYVRLLQIRDFGENPVPTYVNTDSVTKFCNKDDVLIARYGASLGRILTGMEGAYNVALVKVISDDKDFLNEYLFYLLQTQILQRPLTQISRSAQNGFAKSDLADIKLPKPPLPTQHRIVEKIEELFSDFDNGIENLKKANQQLETYKQSVLKAAFEGKLTKEWREQQDDLPIPEELKEQIENERKKYREQQLKEWEQKVEEWKEQGEPGRKPRKPRKPKSFEEPTDEELNAFGNLPENWYWARLGNLSGLITKGSSPGWQGYDYVNDPDELLFVTSENVRKNKLDLSEPKYVELGFNDVQSRSTLKKQDVLFNIVGASIGRAVVFDRDKLANINQAVALIRLYDFINPELLSYYLNSSSLKQFYENKIVDVARANLSLTDVGNFPIPVCSGGEQEQLFQEIESKMSVIIQLRKSLNQELEKAKALRQSILKKAFEGKLIQN